VTDSWYQNLPARQVITGSTEVSGIEILRGQRACDADRERCLDHLAECHGRGYMRTTGVFEARMSAAAEAVTCAELVEVLRDLPALPPPRMAWYQRARTAAGQRTARRWLHLAGAVAALCIAMLVPAVLYAATGYNVTFSAPGDGSWLQVEHSGAMITLIWFFIVTGTVLLAADVAWWTVWENRNS
jgi:Domain of unknown function (DUF1707)